VAHHDFKAALYRDSDVETLDGCRGPYRKLHASVTVSGRQPSLRGHPARTERVLRKDFDQRIDRPDSQLS